MDNKELQKFYIDLREDINLTLVTDEEGTNPEQIFTNLALTFLSDAGETENYRVCFDEKISKRGVEHKINGYSLYENYETLDLFTTVYFHDNEIQSLKKNEIEKYYEKAIKFFHSAMDKNYVNEIEESSEIFDLAHTLANVKEVKKNLTRVNVFIITNGDIKIDTINLKINSLYNFCLHMNFITNVKKKKHAYFQMNRQKNMFYYQDLNKKSTRSVNQFYMVNNSEKLRY
jgi:hypothetical protein